MRAPLYASLLLLLAAACGSSEIEPTPTPDATTMDAGPLDTGVEAPTDAGVLDLGIEEPDAGFEDAAAPDADAVDAGPEDAAPDAGVEDAEVDAGFEDAEVDAGEADAGEADAGLEDAAAPDAEVDAGFPDAGPPPQSCADVLSAGATEDGIYDVDPDGPGVGAPAFSAYCDLTHDGGGWTLVLVSSDDGVTTWSFDNRDLMLSNTATVGDVAHVNRDFKSPAYHQPFRDLLFVHASGDWAAYHDVDDGSRDIGAFLATVPYPNCDTSSGVPMAAGTLSAAQTALCDTDLYFNIGDYDGFNQAYCLNLQAAANTATFGPAWSATFNGGCPFDDPERTGLGPVNACTGPNCVGNHAREQRSYGFGDPLGLNTGAQGAAESYIQMYAR